MDLQNVVVNISNTRSLIPVNGELTNFEARFNVSSTDKAPFRALIVSQAVLDSLPEDGVLEMKEIKNGVFEGIMRQNTGEYDSWYIVLEADVPVVAHASVSAVETELESALEAQAAASAVVPKAKGGGLPLWAILLIAAAVLLLGYFAYQRFWAGGAKVGRALSPAASISAPPPPPSIAPLDEAAIEAPLELDFSDLPEV